MEEIQELLLPFNCHSPRIISYETLRENYDGDNGAAAISLATT